jgi:hypothetical protein
MIGYIISALLSAGTVLGVTLTVIQAKDDKIEQLQSMLNHEVKMKTLADQFAEVCLDGRDQAQQCSDKYWEDLQRANTLLKKYQELNGANGRLESALRERIALLEEQLETLKSIHELDTLHVRRLDLN